MKSHGWCDHFKVDIMDEEGPDMILPIPNGKQIKENYVGKHLSNYDSLLVLSHFKGHPMGGYGGALKQLSIGVASSYGKAYIHGVGKPENILPKSLKKRYKAIESNPVEGTLLTAKDKKFIKRIYIALRSHRRKDHENRSYNEEVMIFRRFTLNK